MERANGYVRFHAWQAVVGLGGLGALAVGVLVLSFLTLLLSPFVFTVLYRLSEVDRGRVGRRVGDLPREGVHRACLEDACGGPVRGTARGEAAVDVCRDLRRRVEGRAQRPAATGSNFGAEPAATGTS